MNCGAHLALAHVKVRRTSYPEHDRLRQAGRVRATLVDVWVRRAAIRPVPLYAREPTGVLGEIETDLADDDEIARDRLDSAFARFESAQPAIADREAIPSTRAFADTALRLGHFSSAHVSPT